MFGTKLFRLLGIHPRDPEQAPSVGVMRATIFAPLITQMAENIGCMALSGKTKTSRNLLY